MPSGDPVPYVAAINGAVDIVVIEDGVIGVITFRFAEGDQSLLLVHLIEVVVLARADYAVLELSGCPNHDVLTSGLWHICPLQQVDQGAFEGIGDRKGLVCLVVNLLAPLDVLRRISVRWFYIDTGDILT